MNRVWNLIFALPLFLNMGCQKEAPPPQPQNPAIPIKITTVEQQNIRHTIYTTGKTINQKEMHLSFKIDGLIDRIFVKESDTVQAQDTLAVLNQTEIRAHHTQAQTAYEKALEDFQRAEILHKDRVMTQTQWHLAKVALESARAARDITTYNLKHAAIIAPTSGRILKKMGESGEMIQAGKPLFVFASQSGHLRLKAGVTDRDILHIASGDSASVTFDAYPQTPIAGQVVIKAATAWAQTGLYDIEMDLHTSQPLLPGMIGHAHIFTQNTKSRLVIPVEALIDADNDRGFVYLFKDSLAYRQPVVIDQLHKDRVLIQEGLTLSDQVVVDGASYLRDQSRVTVAP